MAESEKKNTREKNEKKEKKNAHEKGRSVVIPPISCVRRCK